MSEAGIRKVIGIQESHMNENEIKTKICPQLSIANQAETECIGKKCIAFTTTAHTLKESVLMGTSPDASGKGTAYRFVGDEYDKFINSNNKWKPVVELENGLKYEFDSIHIELLSTQERSTVPYLKIQKLSSVEGYCSVYMKSSLIFKDS